MLIAYGTVEGHTKRDYDYTDYDAVRRFAGEVAGSVERAAVG